MKDVKTRIFLVLFVIFYFATRLVNLKIIPIFTDEAIYSFWAQVALHDPANRFISLEDGKQPLFIWLAAISQKFVADPLVASRLVSVFAGFGSLIGIYLLTKELFDSLGADVELRREIIGGSKHRVFLRNSVYLLQRLLKRLPCLLKLPRKSHLIIVLLWKLRSPRMPLTFRGL